MTPQTMNVQSKRQLQLKAKVHESVNQFAFSLYRKTNAHVVVFFPLPGAPGAALPPDTPTHIETNIKYRTDQVKLLRAALELLEQEAKRYESNAANDPISGGSDGDPGVGQLNSSSDRPLEGGPERTEGSGDQDRESVGVDLPA